MKKLLLTGLVLAASLSANAQETFNYFNPADCDENGWLWFDSADKIGKYVGEGKKIQLLNAPFEIEDPEFPGETIFPESSADATVKGYNTEGKAEGKTGALVLAPAEEEAHGVFDKYRGGGFMVHLPDCATFDVILSSPNAKIYTEIDGERSYVDAKDCRYIWNEGDPNWLNPDDAPLTENHYVEYLNVQDHKYDLTFGEGDVRDYLTIQGNKGEKRTAVFYSRIAVPLYVHAIRIKTYTDVSLVDEDPAAGIKSVANGDANVSVNGKVVTATKPVEINVYNTVGAKVASTYGKSLNCSALQSGVYVVRAGKQAIKVAF